MAHKTNPKALLLFSGGLDSILSAKILAKQGIKITPVCFKSYFFNCGQAQKSAEKLGLELKIIDFSKKHLGVVKNPKYGRGQGMNPCVDCHLLMVKEAQKIMEKEKHDIIATGEVLGERPFSQNIRALKLIEREACLEGRILRPLSAKLLPETIPEKNGTIKREEMFSIQGKSRKPQIALAGEFKIKNFPQPAGGCMLTNLEYARSLKELLEKVPGCRGSDCHILRKGRVFWRDKFLIMVGRNEKENKELKEAREAGDAVLEPKNFPGPSVLVRRFGKLRTRTLCSVWGKKNEKETMEEAKKFLMRYSKKIPKNPKINVV